jgi:hypothetical protein
MGISKTGQSAEARFIKATGASTSSKAGDGDAVLGGSNVEVKKASTTTINQVRAVKYIPLVVLYEPEGKTGRWYVVPAHQTVRLVSSKSRGQHNENPYECATLSVKTLGGYETEEKDLRQATLDAIAAAGRYPQLRAAMEKVLSECKDLAEKSLKYVTPILERLKLSP